MARRKQPRPTRPKGPNRQEVFHHHHHDQEDEGDEEEQIHRAVKRPRKPPSLEIDNVATRREVLLPEIANEDGKEVAEINLLLATSANGVAGLARNDGENLSKHATQRVRMELPIQGKLKMVWALQEVSRQDLTVQVLMYPKTTTPGGVHHGSNSDDSLVSESNEDSEYFQVLLSGEVDGPDAAISALVFLICQGYAGLRPAPCLTCASSCCWDHEPSGRLRVIIDKKAFMNFEGSYNRPRWKRAMQTLITWLRPELVSETRARVLAQSSQYGEEITENFERMAERNSSSKPQVFDPSALYDAVKPSQNEPGLDMSFPELLPDLRPYQRRAAYWMVQRERGFGGRVGFHPEKSKTGTNTSNDRQCPSSSVASSTTGSYPEKHPLWFSVQPLDGSSEFFFNPYTGSVSLEPHDFVSYVKGGILADEMGLGKTVELLACILANPHKDLSVPSAADAARDLLHSQIASRKQERVECACGAVEEDEAYEESWVQCDLCDAWQHATCVGYARPAELKRQSNKANTSLSKRVRTSGSEPLQESTTLLGGAKRRKTGKGVNVQKSTEGSNGRRDSNNEDKYVCGTCAKLIGKVEVNGDCKATLVVCPAPILQQWQEEIVRHTRAGCLRVIVYEGVEKGAFVVMAGKDGPAEDERLTVVSAHDLAAADIVLATYDTLRTDLCHDSDKTKINQRSMRYVKRYPVVPTPLTRLRWWRVCLDEAQMVESSTAKTTEMALLLDAQNRWCVSGTPIQRGLDDLFGLLRFLQAEPFNDHQYWNQALRQPYEVGDAQAMSYMHKFLGVLMWRSTKLLVKNELNLPPQEEVFSWLRFSPVEAHFYRQQHEKCAVKARELIAKYDRQHKKSCRTADTGLPPVTRLPNTVDSGTFEGQTSSLLNVEGDGAGTANLGELLEHRNGNLSEAAGSGGPAHESRMSDSSRKYSNADADKPLSHPEASILSSSLLRLRQACCHPQVGSAGIRSLQQRSPMTMDEILQVLVDKAKIEAEESQRVLIGALNGLAALAAIDADIPLAVSIYREALAITEENAADVDVDPLQKLHTLHNLAEILGISSTLASRVDIFPNGEAGLAEGAAAVFGTLPSKSQKGGGVDVVNPGNVSVSEANSSLEGMTLNEGDGAIHDRGEVSANDKLTNSWAEDANSRTATRLSSSGGTTQTQPIAGSDLLGSKIPRTLRDDVLIKQCQEIRSKYMASFHAKLVSGHAEFESANLQVSEAKKDCEASGGTNWWWEVLTLAGRRPHGGEDLVKKIRYHLLESDNLGKRGRHQNASSLALLFKEISGLKFVVQKELEALGSARDQVLRRLNTLNKAMKNPTAQDAERIVNCPRDSESVNGSLCPHCEMDDLFQVYENRLLLLRTSAAEADGVVTAEDAVIAQHRILAHRRIAGSKDQQGTAARDQFGGLDSDLGRNRRGTAGATEAEVLRAPSETEQILSIIKSYATRAAGGRNAATKHLHIFEAMKKEYSQMRALTKIQREVLYAVDELNMATTRLTLQLPGEETENEVEKLVKLPAEDVPGRNVQLTSEKFDALKDFSRAKGQLRYLKGLSMARRQEDRSRVVSGSANTHAAAPLQGSSAPEQGWHHIDEEACPVCHDKLGSQLMVFPCGHLLCCKCCMVMIERVPAPHGGVSQKRITCPTCRQRTYVGDIAFVDNGSDRNVIAAQMGQLPQGGKADEEASMDVKGSYGTKIEAVVRRLLWVKSKDPAAKVLLFSTWQDVLDVIEHALSANRITFARVKGAKLNVAIQKFKGGTVQASKSRGKSHHASDTNEHVQVLLLPIERAGNGLNLVEAQHVILVEPLQNPAHEAQAINRVHRIGQTRATCVHRFIVSDTVEESVYWLGRRKAELEKLPGGGLGSRARDRHSFSINDVSALFTSSIPVDETGEEGNSSAALHQSSALRLTPAAAAAAAAEARLRLNVASQQVAAQ